MAKNNRLINQYKRMYLKIQQITPEVYAAIALALHREHGWDYECINDLFNASQDIWYESYDADINIIKMCHDETGIELAKGDD